MPLSTQPTSTSIEPEDGDHLRQRADALICAMLPELHRQASWYAPANAHDVVQSVCEKLLRRRLDLLEHPNPLAYALRSVITTAYDGHRRERHEAPLAVAETPSHRPIERREAELETLRILRTLTDGQARAVALVDVDGYTLDEAALRLGVHRGTIARLRARGIARLRRPS
nr:sigma-70 family RNA polymerase sigma factor [Kitasatospora sp. MMS16-BH015]